VRVACVADDGLLRLTLGGLGGAPPGPPGPPGPPVTLAARDLPDGTSLLPPLLAILLAVVFRHVLLALGAAVWLGATLAAGSGPFLGVWLAVRDHVVPSVVDNWLMFLFTVSLMGMVSVLVRGGGVQGLVDLFSRRARGARSTQAMTAAMGTAVFFDDYANSLIVGAAARPLTDARRISREKLSFLVDATSAPIAGVALISTWIGIELQFLAAQLEYVPQAASAYDLFLQIVPFRFYCFLTLGFVWLVALSGRDFGPMLTAERRARRTGAVLREGARPLAAAGLTQAPAKPGAPTRWANAVVPILLTITTAFGGFLVAGYGPMAEAGIPFDLLSFRTWRSAFVYGGDDRAQVLAVAGLVGSAAALLLVVAQRILGLGEAALAWLRGVWAMRLAFGILVLAIAIRGVTEALDTAPFLVSLLHAVPPVWLPLLSFLLAAAVAFATGTSWGTMGILLPVVVPLVAHQLGGDAAAVSGPILLLVVASVLDGAIFGDHCSPISDTTVLSSLASAADHIDHVRTQAPYALVVMVVAGGLGYLLVAATGLSALVVYPAGLALLAAVLFVVGRRPEA
jgi:Na+/H+ antiporter NhaC